MPFFLRLYFAATYFLSISVFMAASLLLNLIAFILISVPFKTIEPRTLRAFLQFLFRLWARFMKFTRALDLRTPDRILPRDKDGSIWIMNHPTLLDASYLMTFITGATCIYKNAIQSNPLYGGVARLANYIPNIGGPDMIRMACNALKRGEDLIVFPEGTRSTQINLDHFKPGFALIAKRAKATIHVLWIQNPHDFLTREASFWKPPRLPATVTIEPIAQVDPASYDTVESLFNAIKSLYRSEAKKRGASPTSLRPFPEDAQVEVEGDSVTATFQLKPDFPYFEGHFPENPIVPGVVQTGWAVAALERLSIPPARSYRISRFKFIQPLKPGDRIALRLSADGDRFSYRVYANEQLASSGALSVDSRA